MALPGRQRRIEKELLMLSNDPPPGVSCWLVENNKFEAVISGPPDSPYEKGYFRLDIELPETYPLAPPQIKFITPIFHPNIDDHGRICLDTLKVNTKKGGSYWRPSLNISTVLTTIRTLMGAPNPDDGLMPEITELYKTNLDRFQSKAREETLKAMENESNNSLLLQKNMNKENNNNNNINLELLKNNNENQKISDSDSSSDSDDSDSDSDDSDSDSDDSDSDSSDSDSSDSDNDDNNRPLKKRKTDN